MARNQTFRLMKWILLSLTVGISPSFGQMTHRNVMADIALSCFESALPTPSVLQLEGSGMAAIVTPSIENGLLSRGFRLSEDDSALRLTYNVELAKVDLSRKGRKQLTRRVSLGLSYKILGGSKGAHMDESVPTDSLAGESLVDAGTCSDTRTDVIDREIAPELGYEGFPATNPSIPPKGGILRFIQPLVLVAATVVGTYLFFNLRSRRADGG